VKDTSSVARSRSIGSRVRYESRREYLQAHILRSAQEAGAFRPWRFRRNGSQISSKA